MGGCWHGTLVDCAAPLEWLWDVFCRRCIDAKAVVGATVCMCTSAPRGCMFSNGILVFLLESASSGMQRVKGMWCTRLHMRSRMRKLQAKPGVLGTGECTLTQSGDDVDDSGFPGTVYPVPPTVEIMWPVNEPIWWETCTCTCTIQCATHTGWG